MIKESINYIEFPAQNLEKTKSFFKEVFGWDFVDFGDEYTDIQNAGIAGGFYKTKRVMSQENGSALIIFKSDRLEESQARVEKAGGKICNEIFSFPGGRRFHFLDPNNNEFAVWSEIMQAEKKSTKLKKVDVKGSCLCRKVEIKANNIETKMTACHCESCKKWGGGTFMAIPCGTNVTFKGEEFITRYKSSEWAERGFCHSCGTHLFFHFFKEKTYNIPVGLFEDTNGFQFEMQYYIDQKHESYSFKDSTKSLTSKEIYEMFMK